MGWSYVPGANVSLAAQGDNRKERLKANPDGAKQAFGSSIPPGYAMQLHAAPCVHHPSLQAVG
jgi:hypothetical protein